MSSVNLLARCPTDHTFLLLLSFKVRRKKREGIRGKRLVGQATFTQ